MMAPAPLPRPYDHPQLRASEVRSERDEVALCLQNASRVRTDNASHKRLRQLLKEPYVLDYLEYCVFESRRRAGEHDTP